MVFGGVTLGLCILAEVRQREKLEREEARPAELWGDTNAVV
jgi:hypothetical protein